MLAQLCPTLCDSMDCSPQAPLFTGFPGKHTGVGFYLLFPSPGDRPNPGMEPTSPALTGGFFAAEPQGSPFKLHNNPIIEVTIFTLF